MVAYLITHGKRTDGFNPVHTSEGLEQIARLRLPDDVNRVVVGTGQRFQEIWAILYAQDLTVPCHTSPFCGGCDGIHIAKAPGETDQIVLTHGEVPVYQHLGLIGTTGFDPWGFVTGLGEGALLCAGSELLLALGFEGIPPKGALFSLDTESRVIALLQQG